MTVSITFQQRLLLLLLLYCRACVRGVCTPAVADPAHITLGRAAYTVCVNSFFLSLSLRLLFFSLAPKHISRIPPRVAGSSYGLHSGYQLTPSLSLALLHRVGCKMIKWSNAQTRDRSSGSLLSLPF